MEQNQLFYPKTVEEAERIVFLPIDLAVKYGPKFMYIWEHLIGLRPLLKSDFKRYVKYGLVIEFKFSEQEVISILKSKSPQKIDKSKFDVFDICDWCNAETYNLHLHHYPIRKSKGGSDVVEICPNCHYEFHAMAHAKMYKITDEILYAFEECKKKKKDLIEKLAAQEV